MRRLLCLLGHDYTRYPHKEDDSLHEDWGYLYCSRCSKSGYMKLSEHDYEEADDSTYIVFK